VVRVRCACRQRLRRHHSRQCPASVHLINSLNSSPVLTPLSQIQRQCTKRLSWLVSRQTALYQLWARLSSTRHEVASLEWRCFFLSPRTLRLCPGIMTIVDPPLEIKGERRRKEGSSTSCCSSSVVGQASRVAFAAAQQQLCKPKEIYREP